MYLCIVNPLCVRVCQISKFSDTTDIFKPHVDHHHSEITDQRRRISRVLEVSLYIYIYIYILIEGQALLVFQLGGFGTSSLHLKFGVSREDTTTKATRRACNWVVFHNEDVLVV